MPVVVIAEAKDGLSAALDAIFEPHGGLRTLLPDPQTRVFIKPNGVHFTPHTHTDPAVLEALLAYLRDHNFKRLAVMESSTGGNLTRLVFQVTGFSSLCRRYGAEAIYLDEGPTQAVDLIDGTQARISARLVQEVIQREDVFYLSLPKLKTHSMATVTLGVKNQQAFPVDADRMVQHNHRTLHRRLAALYEFAQPDFTIIEGLNATAHGHFPPTALLDECLVPMDILIGGVDTLAVDVVGARVLGYQLDEVEHLRLCAEMNLGEVDGIDVRGRPLSSFTQRLPHTLLGRLHPEVKWVIGREKACTEGCRGNSECIQELLYNDHDGRGGWTLVCGSGFGDTDLDDLPGDILVVGPCACDEVGNLLRGRFPDRRVYLVPEHNDLMSNTHYQARLMGVKPLDLVPMHPLRSAWTLFEAKMHRLSARVPPILG